MRDTYPYCELEVFVAGYERGREHAASKPPERSRDEWESAELACRELSLFDLTREGLLILGLQAEFVPREIFDAGVRRALSDLT